jgi:peptidoglycan hydrolase CwlO-like protein
MSQIKKTIFSLALLVSFLFPVLIFSQVDEDTCLDLISDTDKTCNLLGETKCQSALNECLKIYQEKSDFYAGKVDQTKKEADTLENQIYILNNKVRGLNNEIYQSNLMIKDIGLQIGDTETSIKTSKERIDDSQIKLAELLRLVHEQDNRSLVEIMLAEEELSDFFDELAALEALSQKNKELLGSIKDLKVQLETSKVALNEEKGDLEQTVVARIFQKQESLQLQNKQEYLLDVTKGQEEVYQKYLEENKEIASEIRKRIFNLAQVADEEAPSFEEAYKLAQYAEEETGVRAELILGLLEVESAVGKNVGQCNCEGQEYCRYPDIHYKEIMTQNHWEYFIKITDELGLDPNKTPVSCAISGGKVQWGGAMGPAQFMPGTWLGLGYKDRIEKITGEIASPWIVRDAFIAAGLYLQDWGADSQNLQKEIGSVTAYLCGTSYMTARCQQAGGVGYRNLVIQKASQWEKWAEEGVF